MPPAPLHHVDHRAGAGNDADVRPIEAESVELGEQRLVLEGGFRHEQQLLILQIRRRQPRLPPQGRRRAHERKRCRLPHLEHVAVGKPASHAHDDGDVRPSGAYRLIAVLAAHLCYPQPIGMLRDELVGARRYPRKQVGAHRKVQHLVGRIGIGEGHVQAVHLRHDLARLANQLPPRGREHHLVAPPLEQHDAELVLERLDGMGDVLPAGEAPLRRLRIAGMLCCSQHVAELVDLHMCHP